jgi:hypothetical protein
MSSALERAMVHRWWTYRHPQGGENAITQLDLLSSIATQHTFATSVGCSTSKCAWFNEHEYCEFFPRALLSRGRQQLAA